MKFSPQFLALLAVVRQASAQITAAPCPSCSAEIAAVPSCASSCISSAAATNAHCADGDFSCQCASATVIQNAAVGCVLGACGNDAVAVLTSVSAVCSCVSASGCAQATPTSTPDNSPTTTPASDPVSTPDSDPALTYPADSDPAPTYPDSSDPYPTYPADSDPSPTYPVTDPAPYPTTTPPPSSSCAAGSAAAADCGAVAASAVPSCAQACFSSYAPNVGCGATDFGCQCQPAAQASLSALLVPCVASACPAASLPAVISGASSVCACATAAPMGGNCGGSAAYPTTTTSTPCSESTQAPTYPAGGSGSGSSGHGSGSGSGSYPAGGSGSGSGSGSYPAGGSGSGSSPGSGSGSDSYPAGGSTTCVAVTLMPSSGSSGSSGSGSSGGSNECAPLAKSIEGCAQSCFSSAIPQVGCDVTDYKCQCSAGNQAQLSSLLVPCIATACQAAVLPSIIAEASAVCACAATAGSGAAAPTAAAAAEPITTTTCYPVGGSMTKATSYPTGTISYKPYPTVTAGANLRFEMGVVGTIFGAAWAAAVAL